MTTRELGSREDTGASSGRGFGSTLMRVAWLAIGLGLGIEVLLLMVSVFGGLGSATFVADLVKSVAWSVFVCVGLAVGTAITRAQVEIGERTAEG